MGVGARTGPQNRLEVRLEGVDSVTLWVEEAGIDVDDEVTVEIESDAPATVTLATTLVTHELEVPAGESTETVRLTGSAVESGAPA